jgi:uncharacterized membrane protein YgcG
MAQTSGIEIAISGNTTGLDRALGKAESSLSRFAKGAAAGIAGALSAGVFVAAGKAAIDFADAVGKSAQKVGSTTKALSELSYAAKLSDLTFTDLETGMRFLSKSMVNNADLFNQLGVAIQNSDGSLRSTDQVLMDLADRFASIPDGAQKTALAMELLGRSGASMIPMLNAGSNGLEQMRQRAIDLGISISEDTAKRAEQFNDTISDLGAVGQGAMIKLASATLPLAQAFLNVSVAGAEAMVKLGGTIQEIAPYAAIAVAAIAGFYAPAVLTGLAATAGGLIAISNAIKSITLAMLANPIGLIVGALAGASVAAFVFRDDIKSAIGVDVVNIAKDAANFVARGFINAYDGIKTVFLDLPNAIGAAFVGMSNAVLRTLADMTNKAIGYVNNVIDAVNKIASYTGVTFDRVGEVTAFQFTNTFASNFEKEWSAFTGRMASRVNEDFVGAFSTAAGNAVSSAFGAMGGGLAVGGGGGGGANVKTEEESKSKDVVPGIAPSQEVDAFYMARLESIREGFKSEREILEAEYAADMELLRGHLTGKDELDAEFKELMRQRAEQHANDLNEIERMRVQNDLQNVETGLGSMAAAFQNGGKKMLKVAKALGAAQAIVATLVAATQAMQVGLTPAEKFAAYAAVFAKGMSAVAAIKGVSEGGGGGGGGSGGGGGRRGGGGGASAAPAAASPTTTFQFTMMNDPMGFGEKFARQFIDQLNSTQRNGGTIRGVIA